MSELDLLLNEMTTAAQHFMDLTNELRSMFTTKEELVVEEEKPVSFTDLRALCVEKSRNGFTSQVHDLITSLGAAKLSEVEPNKYGELYRKVEALA